MSVTDPITREPCRLLLLRFLSVGLATVFAFLTAPVSGDPADGRSAKVALAEEQVHVADPTVYRWVFGDGSDAVTARKQLEMFLSQKVMLVDRVCGLTDAQKQTLQLAGRGDNKRLLARVEEMGMQLQLVKNDENKVEALFQDAKTLRHHVGAGLSHEMFFVKSLEKTLTAEQLVRYEPLRAVLSAGGMVQPWLQKSDELLEVTLTGTGFADDGLAQLSDLPGVRALALGGTQVTDAGLAHLKRLTHMRRLILDDTRITDAGVAQLKELTNLEELFLTKTQVTDAGLVHLKRLSKLKVLGLEKTRVTDEGLAHLKGLTGLYFLMLMQTKVTDSGLTHLRELTKLEVLWLADTRVTDTGLVHLQALPNLVDLRLGGTRVSDAGLAHLTRMTSLGILTLDKTKVTGAGIADLQRALPELTVSTATSVQGASSRTVP
jgi:hypothetical protein